MSPSSASVEPPLATSPPTASTPAICRARRRSRARAIRARAMAASSAPTVRRVPSASRTMTTMKEAPALEERRHGDVHDHDGRRVDGQRGPADDHRLAPAVGGGHRHDRQVERDGRPGRHLADEQSERGDVPDRGQQARDRAPERGRRLPEDQLEPDVGEAGRDQREDGRVAGEELDDDGRGHDRDREHQMGVVEQAPADRPDPARAVAQEERRCFHAGSVGTGGPGVDGPNGSPVSARTSRRGSVPRRRASGAPTRT